MLSNRPGQPAHPEDLFEAYALDVLAEDEVIRVESHLEHCAPCAAAVGQIQETATLLAAAVEQGPAPAYLRDRVLAGLPGTPEPVAASRPWAFLPKLALPAWFNARGLAIPAAVALGAILFGVSVAMNLQLNSRVEQLAQENSTVTIQMARALQNTERLQQERSALAARLEPPVSGNFDPIFDLAKTPISLYLEAFPDTQPVIMDSINLDGDHEGMLLVADDGMRATMMISNMDAAASDNPFLVWLVREGVWTPVGKLNIDSSGWGSLNFTPEEPVYLFDSVNVTIGDRTSGDNPQEGLVLSSRIPYPANPP